MALLKILTTCSLGLAMVSALASGKETYDASFESFRTEIEEAIDQRDWAWFERHMVESGFLSSLGPSSGREEFVKMWEPQSANSPLWPALDLILSVSQLSAGEQGNGTCVGPTPRYGEEGLLAEEKFALVGSAVPLRLAPAIDARVTAVVSTDWVSVIENRASLSQEEPAWVKVRTSTGREGYVDGYLLKSAASHRLCYSLRNGEWRITAFVGGE